MKTEFDGTFIINGKFTGFKKSVPISWCKQRQIIQSGNKETGF
jgi:hypothetical protein